MSGKISLTEKQQKCLGVIKDYLAKHGHGPSVRDIAQAMKLKSPSSVARLLIGLELRGHIQREPGMKRAIRIL